MSAGLADVRITSSEFAAVDIIPKRNSRRIIISQLIKINSTRLIWTAVFTVAIFSALAFLVPFVNDSNLHAGRAPFLDDFYYYFVIGRRLLENGALTFDGYTKTNGFHPAWLGIIVAIQWLFQKNLTDQYLAILVVSFALLALAGIQAYRTSRAIAPEGEPPLHLLNGLFVASLCLGSFRPGMETNLIVVFGLGAICSLLRIFRATELS